MKTNKWKVAFWIAAGIAVIGWYYFIQYYGYFNEAIDLAEQAIELAKQCAALLP